MGYSRDDYFRECFEIAMEDAGCGRLLSQMTEDQRDEVGGAIAGGAENVGLAFYTPENPMIAETKRLERKLKWERDLTGCQPCRGSGRLKYNAGPWVVDSHCDHCNGRGKVHPHNEAEPA